MGASIGCEATLHPLLRRQWIEQIGDRQSDRRRAVGRFDGLVPSAGVDLDFCRLRDCPQQAFEKRQFLSRRPRDLSLATVFHHQRIRLLARNCQLVFGPQFDIRRRQFFERFKYDLRQPGRDALVISGLPRRKKPS